MCDVTIRPTIELNSKLSPNSLHESLSYSISKIFKYCPRVDQLKFNQVVTKKRDYKDELEFEVSNAIYNDWLFYWLGLFQKRIICDCNGLRR